MRKGGRNWHEVYLLVLTAAFVGSAWATGGDAQVIADSFPAWLRHTWYGGLVGGAIIGLGGIALRNPAGLRIEQGALFWLAGLCGFYGLTFLAHAHRADLAHVLYVVPLVLAYAAVNLVRARQITREIDYTLCELRRLGDIREAETGP